MKNRLLKFISIVLILSVCTIILPSCSGSLEFTLSEDGTYYSVSVGTCKDKDIVIPAEYEGLPVKEIAEGAFSKVEALESVTIPSSVIKIDKGAFLGCTNLKAINLPVGLVEIDDGAFRKSGIEELVIPNTVTRIGKWAFLGSQLKSITLGKNITVIEEEAFFQCFKLKSVNMNSSIKKIEKGAFYGCYRLEDISFPDGLEVIEDSAFAKCSELKSLILPDSLISIGSHVFFNCSKIADVKFGESLSVIGERAFYNCESITALTLPSTLTELGNENFFISKNEHVADGEGTTVGKDIYYYMDIPIYYCGTSNEWANIESPEFAIISFPQIMFYSETEPSLNEDKTGYDGNYWRYVDGVETPWVFNQA